MSITNFNIFKQQLSKCNNKVCPNSQVPELD